MVYTETKIESNSKNKIEILINEKNFKKLNKNTNLDRKEFLDALMYADSLMIKLLVNYHELSARYRLFIFKNIIIKNLNLVNLI